jgi:hypothetical protein
VSDCDCGAPRCEREGCQDKPTVDTLQLWEEATRAWRDRALKAEAELRRLLADSNGCKR